MFHLSVGFVLNFLNQFDAYWLFASTERKPRLIIVWLMFINRKEKTYFPRFVNQSGWFWSLLFIYRFFLGRLFFTVMNYWNKLWLMIWEIWNRHDLHAWVDRLLQFYWLLDNFSWILVENHREKLNQAEVNYSLGL